MMVGFMRPNNRQLSFAITLAVSLVLVIAPVYSSGRTLVEVNGPRVFGVLGIPVVIALGPLVVRRLRIPAAVAMGAFVVLAGLSIGLFYLPSTVLLAWPERR
jgi:hypothetical protein